MGSKLASRSSGTLSRHRRCCTLEICLWECMEEELIELGKPFGKIVNTKVNVGSNCNQAFVEFVMVSCYFSLLEQDLVWGKTRYLQYSNRHEIINFKNSKDEASNALLVRIEGTKANNLINAKGKNPNNTIGTNGNYEEDLSQRLSHRVRRISTIKFKIHWFLSDLDQIRRSSPNTQNSN
jgi:hypothetical protein